MKNATPETQTYIENSIEPSDQDKKQMRIINALLVLLVVALLILSIYGYQAGYFTNIEELRALLNRFGAFSFIAFIILQILQILFPILPGGVGLVAGVVLFGPIFGFIYNYIGIVIGSFIAFGIAKRYGRNVVYKLFSRKLADKYFHWVDTKTGYKKLFALAVFLPGAPDDLLCYIIGTTAMTWKEYALIILLAKPFSIAIYSLGLTSLLSHLLSIHL